MRGALRGTGCIAVRSLLSALPPAGYQVVRVGSRYPDRADDIRADPDLGVGALLDIGFCAAAISRWVTRDEPEVAAACADVGRCGVGVATAALLRLPEVATAAFPCARTRSSAWSAPSPTPPSRAMPRSIRPTQSLPHACSMPSAGPVRQLTDRRRARALHHEEKPTCAFVSMTRRSW